METLIKSCIGVYSTSEAHTSSCVVHIATGSFTLFHWLTVLNGNISTEGREEDLLAGSLLPVSKYVFIY